MRERLDHREQENTFPPPGWILSRGGSRLGEHRMVWDVYEFEEAERECQGFVRPIGRGGE